MTPHHSGGYEMRISTKLMLAFLQGVLLLNIFLPTAAADQICVAQFLFTVGKSSDISALETRVFSDKIVKQSKCQRITFKGSLFEKGLSINTDIVTDLTIVCNEPHKALFGTINDILLEISDASPDGAGTGTKIYDPITLSATISTCTSPCVRARCRTDGQYYCTKNSTKACDLTYRC
jgi:hypothetical protein